nr:bifunctional DNA primase/polymerase [Bifidobacterium sp. SO4]
MVAANRWVRWQRIVRGDGTTKNPRTIDGRQASSTDPTTWSPFADARISTIGDGMGFVLGDGFACIDLDHCYDARNHLTDWAKMLIAPVQGKTYIETSPSGDGLHIWGRAPERTGLKVRGIMNAEAYSRARYITYTGRAWHKSPAILADLTFLFDVIARLS